MATLITVLRAHKPLTVIVLSWVAFCVLWLIPKWREGPEPLFFLVLSAGFLTLLASQLFWIGRIRGLGKRFIPGTRRRIWLAVIAFVVYLFFLLHNFGLGDTLLGGDSTHLTLRRFLIDGGWSVWLAGSWVGFGLVIIFWIVDRIARAAWWVYRRSRKAAASHAGAPISGAIAPDPISPTRRRLLEQTAVVVSAAPFVAAAYGLLYGRLDMEVTRPRIRLARLPKAFEGFRIAQLSDFHISPFMTASEIRCCVTIANGLNADLVVLTGDYVLDDARAQGEVLNLIGIDYQSLRFSLDHAGHEVERYLAGNEKLVMPNMVNILLSHNPKTFDRAAQLGIDLTLAGHTHGGEFEFVHRGLALVRLETPYVSGWFEKAGAQLYVNRGIGTTGFPIRFGARPEITVIELVRGV